MLCSPPAQQVTVPGSAPGDGFSPKICTAFSHCHGMGQRLPARAGKTGSAWSGRTLTVDSFVENLQKMANKMVTLIPLAPYLSAARRGESTDSLLINGGVRALCPFWVLWCCALICPGPTNRRGGLKAPGKAGGRTEKTRITPCGQPHLLQHRLLNVLLLCWTPGTAMCAGAEHR